MQVGIQWCEAGTRNTRLQEQGALLTDGRGWLPKAFPPNPRPIAYMSSTTGQSSSTPQSSQKAYCLTPKYTQMTKNQQILRKTGKYEKENNPGTRRRKKCYKNLIIAWLL